MSKYLDILKIMSVCVIIVLPIVGNIDNKIFSLLYHIIPYSFYKKKITKNDGKNDGKNDDKNDGRKNDRNDGKKNDRNINIYTNNYYNINNTYLSFDHDVFDSDTEYDIGLPID
jgi:hypothetical protein